MNSWKLVLPWAASTPNRHHGRSAGRWIVAKERREAERLALAFACIPRATGPRGLHITRRAHGLLDPFENLPSAHKAFVDALVRAGVLTGDAARHGNRIVATQERIPRSEPVQTLVLLEDL